MGVHNARIRENAAGAALPGNRSAKVCKESHLLRHLIDIREKYSLRPPWTLLCSKMVVQHDAKRQVASCRQRRARQGLRSFARAPSCGFLTGFVAA